MGVGKNRGHRLRSEALHAVPAELRRFVRGPAFAVPEALARGITTRCISDEVSEPAREANVLRKVGKFTALEIGLILC